MTRGIFVGDTDYSRQSFDDMIEDIKNWAKNIDSVNDFFQQNIQLLTKSGYLDKKVPDDFKILIYRTIEIFETSIKELNEILNELEDDVREDHTKRLYSLGIAAKKLGNHYGTVWHQQYSNKKYGDKDFNIIENIYSNGRGQLYDMIDLCNLSKRLEDFVGRKTKSNLDLLELKPNFYGLGLNLNNLIKKFKKKK